MKRIAFLLPVAMLALAACQSATQGDPGPATNSNAAVEAPTSGGVTAGTVIDEKAMYAAEAAYNVAANAYVTADGNGLLSAATKAKVKPYMLQAYDALKLARAAYKAGDSAVFVQQVARLNDYADMAKALLR